MSRTIIKEYITTEVIIALVTSDFSPHSVGPVHLLSNVFSVLRINNCQSRIIYPTNRLCKSEGENDMFKHRKTALIMDHSFKDIKKK